MFIFASIAFRFESPGITDLQILSFFRRHFPESFRAESLRLGIPVAYDRNFSQALSNDPSAVRRFQKPPLPFAFRICGLCANSHAEDDREVVLSIAGDAVNDIDCYIGAVKRVFSAIGLEQGISTKIREISTIAADGASNEIGTDNRCEVTLISGDDMLPPLWPVSAIDLDFVSPLRLLREGETLHRLTFSDYIRPLMRRVSALAYYYCGMEFDLDFQRLANDSLNVSSDDKALVWVKEVGSASGIQGRVRFNGDLQEYLRFMVLGERFNLGKGAAYGMGAYRYSTVNR